MSDSSMLVDDASTIRGHGPAGKTGPELGARLRGPIRPIDALETSLGFLMSRFAAVPSHWLAQAVLAQLEILSGAPDEAGMNERRRTVYRQLIPTWSGISRRLLATHAVQA